MDGSDQPRDDREIVRGRDGKPLRDTEILDWASQLVRAVLLDDIAAAASRQS